MCTGIPCTHTQKKTSPSSTPHPHIKKEHTQQHTPPSLLHAGVHHARPRKGPGAERAPVALPLPPAPGGRGQPASTHVSHAHAGIRTQGHARALTDVLCGSATPRHSQLGCISSTNPLQSCAADRSASHPAHRPAPSLSLALLAVRRAGGGWPLCFQWPSGWLGCCCAPIAVGGAAHTLHAGHGCQWGTNWQQRHAGSLSTPHQGAMQVRGPSLHAQATQWLARMLVCACAAHALACRWVWCALAACTTPWQGRGCCAVARLPPGSAHCLLAQGVLASSRRGCS